MSYHKTQKNHSTICGKQHRNKKKFNRVIEKLKRTKQILELKYTINEMKEKKKTFNRRHKH